MKKILLLMMVIICGLVRGHNLECTCRALCSASGQIGEAILEFTTQSNEPKLDSTVCVENAQLPGNCSSLFGCDGKRI